MSTSTPATPYHHGDLRRALLQEGEKVLTEQGPSDLSLRELARRLGVSHNAPYRHFSTREALLATLAEAGYRDLAERIEAVGDPVDLAEAMIARGLAYVGFALDRPAVFRLMFGGLIDRAAFPDLAAASAASLEVFADRIATTYGEEALTEATLSAWSFLHGLASLLLDHQVPPGMRGGRPDRDLAEAVIRAMSKALAGEIENAAKA